MKRFSLGEVVAQATDMFFRDYPSGGAFWDEDNFKANVIAYLAKLINDEYDDRKQRNKVLEGFSSTEFSSSWLVEEKCKVVRDDDGDWFQTSIAVFEFTFDALASGILSIEKLGKCNCTCGDIIRLSNKDYWKYERLPKTSNVYWSAKLDKVFFPCSQCLPEEFRVTFLPAINMDTDVDCAMVPEPYVTPVITTVLNQMFGAKDGTPFIDKSNDGNPNQAGTSELDKNTLKQ